MLIFDSCISACDFLHFIFLRVESVLIIVFSSFFITVQDDLARTEGSTAEAEAGATLILNAEALSSMHVKSLNLTPKGVGGNSELQTDGDVQSRDISHLDGRELQVNKIKLQ